jgi:hypothetical protein
MLRLSVVILGAGLLAATSFANAAGQLAPVKVQVNTRSIAVDCAPPNASRECSEFHALIRRNFSTREIGMLFGAATAYQEYLTTNDHVHAKYAAFLRDAEANGLAVAVAAK